MLSEVEKLLTPEDVASILSIDVTTLRDWRWRGVGPEWIDVSAVGSKRATPRYSPAAIRAYQERGRRGGSVATVVMAPGTPGGIRRSRRMK